MWDPPPTVGVLSNLTYHLTVTNMNTGVVIINTTTTDTSYTVGDLKLCIFYNASVAAASQDQSGDAKFIKQRIPGGINLESSVHIHYVLTSFISLLQATILVTCSNYY